MNQTRLRSEENALAVLELKIRLLRKAVLLMGASLLVGLALGQRLPSTFLQNPLATVRLMRSLPLGSRVIPATAIRENNLFRKADMEGYWLVIGYEAVRGLDGESVLLCQVRIQNGTGPLLAVKSVVALSA